MPEKNTSPLPLSFRDDLLERVLADLRAGECCSLIGTSGTGKSNIARFLRRQDVQHFYWKDDRTWVILIDSHSLIFDNEQKAEYVITELMIQGVIEEAENHSFSDEFLTRANQLYDRLIDHPGIHVALRTLRDLCKRLCGKDNLQLIFAFDQFENIWQTLDASFFLNLRNLRDQFKYQVVYLVMIRDRLQRMRQDSQAVESFWELFSAHTYGLGPYSERDAFTMVERLASRAQVDVSNIAQEIVRLSGGHPGILRAVFWAFRDSSRKTFSVDELLQIASVSEECEKVWNSLSSNEQHLCQIIVQGLLLHHPNSETLNDLQIKGISSGDPPILFSPLFATYILQKTESNLSGIMVDIRHREIWLDGQLLQHPFTPLEFRLLECLAHRVGDICKREDLLHELYGETYYDKSDQRLYAILTRVREALGEDARNPRYLITHRGGLQLTKGGIINDR